MTSVNVNTRFKYKVYIDRGLIKDAGELIYHDVYQGRDVTTVKALVVLNSDLVKYSDDLTNSLKATGFQVDTLELPIGEEAKNYLSVGFILNRLARIDFSRDDILISFGGGSVSDVVGFAASVYKRGTYLAHIPTTLLAMVDSAVGGKTAINYDGIKNLIGSFYQPNLVIEDTAMLDTIEGKNLRSGIGELIKYGVLDKKIFYRLYGEVKTDCIDDLIRDCVKVKAKYVEKDEQDEGERLYLNLGHTVGHAIETLSGFRTPHGIAVAAGILCIAKCMDKAYGTDTAEKISRVLDIQGILADIPYSADDILRIISKDKKWAYGKLNVVVFDDIGQPRVQEFSPDEFEVFLKGGLNKD